MKVSTRAPVVLVVFLSACGSSEQRPAPAPAPAPASKPADSGDGGITIKGSRRPDSPPPAKAKPAADSARIEELKRKATERPTGSPVTPDAPPAEEPKLYTGPLVSEGDVLAMLRGRDFNSLEKAFDNANAAGRKEGSFDMKRSDVVPSWHKDGAALADLDAWCEARPKSTHAFNARGSYKIRWAWEARGSGWASTVTDEGWKLFGERLQSAKVDLEKACANDPRNPNPLGNLITVCRGLSLPRQEAERYLRDAVAADPTHLGAYFDMMEYLKPRWHGSDEELFAFARQQIAARPNEPALKILLVIAHIDHAEYSDADAAAYVKRADVVREVEECCEAVSSKYPASKSDVDSYLARFRAAPKTAARHRK